MTALTVQNMSDAGGELTPVAAAASQTMPNPSDQRNFLYVKNGDGSDHDITITAQVTSKTLPGIGAMTKADKVVTVTAGEFRLIGPFPALAYNNENGEVEIAWSATTSMTVAAVRLPTLD